MEKLIACCGLNCEACDARIATINDSDVLRKATAENWKKTYNAPDIPIEAINCTGCRMAGVKFSHCTVCEIRNCVQAKGYKTCGECPELKTCQIVAKVHKHVPDAIKNLNS